MAKIRKLTTTWIAAGALFAAAGSATAEAPEPTPTFDDVTVTVALHSGAFELAWAVHKEEIKALYGINMEIVGIPVNELFDKEILELSMGSGAFDLVQFNPGWMGDYVDFLEPLDPYMDRWDPAWEDIHEGFRVWENTYQGTRYSLTMDGDILFTYYNSDVYGNSDEQAAFKEKYGYDLAPPATWDQVVDIQEFFRRDTDGDGEIDSWGYSDPIIKRGRGFYSFLLRYINYAGPNPQYMDPETMVPLINGEAGVQALENYKRTIDLGPPGMLSWEWDEAHAAFMQGRVQTLVHWPDEGLMTDLYTANTGAEMGFAKMPGAMVGGEKMERTMTGGGWIIGNGQGQPEQGGGLHAAATHPVAGGLPASRADAGHRHLPHLAVQPPGDPEGRAGEVSRGLPGEHLGQLPRAPHSGRIRVLRRARRRGAEGARGRALGSGGARRGGGQLGADHRPARTRRTA